MPSRWTGEKREIQTLWRFLLELYNLFHRTWRQKRFEVTNFPRSFFQVNPIQDQRLIETVLEFSEVTEKDVVLDLYAGVGNLTLPLAVGASEVFLRRQLAAGGQVGINRIEERRLAIGFFVPGHWFESSQGRVTLGPHRPKN
jgi:hypothetical protein